MKKIILTLAAALTTLSISAQETQRVMKVSLSDGNEATYALSEITEVTFEEEEIVYEENGHAYVDLGLESGTLWAIMNVGAESVTDYGYYFAWGETEAKETYSNDTYSFYDSEAGSYIEYTIDGKTALDLEDDAASVIWGSDWRMPTSDEIDELINNCTTTWTYGYEDSGVAGYILTSKNNNNSIFLPAAGFLHGSSPTYVGSYGYYWSSSLSSASVGYARNIFFYSNYFRRTTASCCHGLSVRPVRSSSLSE